jgi:hypothetical protein
VTHLLVESDGVEESGHKRNTQDDHERNHRSVGLSTALVKRDCLERELTRRAAVDVGGEVAGGHALVRVHLVQEAVPSASVEVIECVRVSDCEWLCECEVRCTRKRTNMCHAAMDG